jgi:flagellar L-ring protein precursor FlgH
VQGQLNQLFRATSNMQTTDSIKFEIAAKVAAVLPNGTIVLEAHREITNNEEVWIHSLTGICRREDIGPGNIVLSKDVADLKIDKQETGHVRDGYRRGWLQRWFDTFSPF